MYLLEVIMDAIRIMEFFGSSGYIGRHKIREAIDSDTGHEFGFK